MKNYKDYTVKDFLSDEYFLEWVRCPSGECKHFWEQWLLEHPEKAQTIRLAKEIIASLAYKNNHYPTRSEKSEVLENIMNDRCTKKIETFTPESGWSRWSRFAAAAVVAMILAWWGVFNFLNHTSEEASTQSSAMVSKQTAYGEKKTIRLPDGTMVKLNYGSTLTFPKKFSSEAREVTLSGEAFFDVQPNPTKPFVLDTEGLKVTVLGTSFNVKAYANEQDVQVAVATGKVKVQAKGTADETLVLLPDEQTVLNKETQHIVKGKANLSDVLAWREGTLVLRKATFRQVLDRLEQWYGVTIILEKGLKMPGKFTGKFKNQPLENVLIGLSFSSYVHYTIEGKMIKIRSVDLND